MAAEEWLIIAMLATFIGLLFTGFPVAWVLAGTGVLFTLVGYLADQYLDTATGLDYSTLGLVPGRLFAIMDNWVLVAVPMFILMGLILEKSAIAERLMLSMQRLFGGMHGGLSLTVVLVGVILAASTGIIGASVVLLGIISLPLMLKQGYQSSFALGTIASAGCLGILIPPSIMLVIMGDQLSLSVGDLFMGAVFPGLILSALYVLYIVISSRLTPAKAPLSEDSAPLDTTVLLGVMKDMLPTLMLVVMVLGSIILGVATVTEAAGVGVAGALILSLIYQKFSFGMLAAVIRETSNTVGYIFAIFVGATVFALVLRELGGDEFVQSLLTDLPFGELGILLVVIATVFLLGFFLDWIEISLVVLPLLAPVVSAMTLGIDGHGVLDEPQLLWFALLISLTLQTSFLTPPVGFALFYLKGVCPPEIHLREIYRGVLPFILLQIAAIAIVLLFPETVTWLPSVVYDQ
ncbi:MAG: TRAP transporter large permease [bacterium]